MHELLGMYTLRTLSLQAVSMAIICSTLDQIHSLWLFVPFPHHYEPTDEISQRAATFVRECHESKLKKIKHHVAPIRCADECQRCLKKKGVGSKINYVEVDLAICRES